VGDVLDQRRESTNSRLKEIHGKLAGAENRAAGKACVYATGSFARGEANPFSDLDLFIVGRGTRESRSLRRLDEICVKADLIQVTRELNFPEFSGDGEYLTHHTVDELIGTLGKPQDDAANTFTARLLLLLESQPLIGGEVYSDAIDQVIAAYWRDYQNHKSDFMPAFLANDILRIWRTFCVNYEARTATDPPEKKAKRKLKNYKLKHSRLLTCYSALAYLLAIYRTNGTVAPTDVLQMVGITPTQRLEWLASEGDERQARIVGELLERYERFLERTNESEQKLVADLLDPSHSPPGLPSEYEFGDKLFELLEAIGTGSGGEKNRFYRLLVV
jgi:predicted nucleotidyltransferase